MSSDLNHIEAASQPDLRRRPIRTLYVDDDSVTASILLSRLESSLMVTDRYRIDPASVDTLRALCAHADAVVVVSTGWDSDVAEAAAVTVDALIANLNGTGKRLLYLSDATVVGDTGDTFGNEDNPRSHHAPHSWQVTAEEHLARSVATGVHSVVVRPTFVHGRGAGALLSRLQEYANRAHESLYVADGHARTSTIHIDDLAELVERALVGGPTGHVFTAASDEVLSWQDIAAVVAASTTPPAPIRSSSAAEADRHGLDSATMTTNCVMRDESGHRRLGWTPRAPTLAAEAASARSAER